MHCREVLAKTSAYIDDELDSTVASEMADHFRQCQKCRRELEELSGIDAFIKDLPRYDMPGAFAEQMVLKVYEMQAPGQISSLPWRVWTSLLGFIERFFCLLDPASSPSTHALEEFDDVPSSFIGYAYFKVMSSSIN